MINKMRRAGIFVLFALSMILKGSCAWWAAAGRMAEPIILSFGAAFAALGLNDKVNQDEPVFEGAERIEKLLKESLDNSTKEMDRLIKEKID